MPKNDKSLQKSDAGDLRVKKDELDDEPQVHPSPINPPPERRRQLRVTSGQAAS